MIKRILGALLITACLLLGLYFIVHSNDQADNDEKSTSDKIACDISSTECSDEIKEDLADYSNFEEITMDTFIKLMQDGSADGIYYFGYNDCPWCIDMSPLVNEAAKAKDQTIYFIRTRDADHNLLYTDDQKQILLQYISDYMSENDDGEMTLYVPLLLRVENGQAICGHVGTVDGHDATKTDMTEKQINEASQIIESILNGTAQGNIE